MVVRMITTNGKGETKEKVYESKSNVAGIKNAMDLVYKLGMKKIQVFNNETNELLYSKG